MALKQRCKATCKRMQQCWELLANNVVSVCTGLKVWLVSNFAQQHATTSNNIQQGVQTDATCNIQQCWEFLANNVASVCMHFKTTEMLSNNTKMGWNGDSSEEKYKNSSKIQGLYSSWISLVKSPFSSPWKSLKFSFVHFESPWILIEEHFFDKHSQTNFHKKMVAVKKKDPLFQNIFIVYLEPVLKVINKVL